MLVVRFALIHKCRNCGSGNASGEKRTEPRLSASSVIEELQRTTSLRRRHQTYRILQVLTTALPNCHTQRIRKIKLMRRIFSMLMI